MCTTNGTRFLIAHHLFIIANQYYIKFSVNMGKRGLYPQRLYRMDEKSC